MKTTLDDGVTLAYDDFGSGAGTILFVHGWLCDRQFFAPQIEYFRNKYRVISVDLRGHGGSDKPIQNYHPDRHAADLAQLCERLGIDRPVLVGHSLGGVIGLRFAFLYPRLLSTLIALDSVWVMTPQVNAMASLVTEILQRDDYREALAEIIEGFFRPHDDPERCSWITRVMTSAPREVMMSGWSETLERTNTLEALFSLSVPTLYVAAPTQPGGLEVIRAAPNVAVGETVGSGHFLQLECPEQVNAMIARFLYTKGVA